MYILQVYSNRLRCTILKAKQEAIYLLIFRFMIWMYLDLEHFKFMIYRK